MSRRTPKAQFLGLRMVKNYLPPEVHRHAAVAAQASEKSLNQWANEVLRRELKMG